VLHSNLTSAGTTTLTPDLRPADRDVPELRQTEHDNSALSIKAADTTCGNAQQRCGHHHDHQRRQPTIGLSGGRHAAAQQTNLTHITSNALVIGGRRPPG